MVKKQMCSFRATGQVPWQQDAVRYDKMDIFYHTYYISKLSKAREYKHSRKLRTYFAPLSSSALLFPLELEAVPWTERVRLYGAGNAFVDHIALWWTI